jgi:hypothetical protein
MVLVMDYYHFNQIIKLWIIFIFSILIKEQQLNQIVGRITLGRVEN